MCFDISQSEIELFKQQGYLVLESVFADEVKRYRVEVDRVIEFLINSSLYHDRRSRRLDIRGDGEPQSIRRVQPVNDLSLALSDLADDERLRRPIEQIMGEPPRMMEDKLTPKYPLPEPVEGIDTHPTVDRFPIHHDWGHFNSDGYTDSIISAAVAIDDCESDSGPLTVWPGTHRRRLEHEEFQFGNRTDIRIPEEKLDDDNAVELTVPAGSVILFHALVAHSSSQNTSGRPRRMMIYSFFPGSEHEEMYHDERNGPRRLNESPYEWEYATRWRDSAERAYQL